MNLTIVTIVKNDAEGFLRTSDSLVQLNHKFQWMVVSPDIEILHLLSDLIHDNPNLNAEFIHDQGEGIYFAMQCAVEKIPNDHWVWFVNAGDYFYKNTVIEELESLLARENLDWVSTKVRYLTQSGDFLFSSSPWRDKKSQLFARNFASHQGFICRSHAIKKVGGFDLGYQIAGDWDLICKVTQQFSGESINLETVVFHLGGTSSVQRQLGNKELLELRKFHLGKEFKVHSYIWFAHRFMRNRFILSLEDRNSKFANVARKWFWKIKMKWADKDV